MMVASIPAQGVAFVLIVVCATILVQLALVVGVILWRGKSKGVKTKPAAAEHHIETMEQLLAVVDERTLNDVAGSMAEWLQYAVDAKGVPGVEVRPVFIWVDDGEPGISGIRWEKEVGDAR